ncbi:hotdog domain-containing protein [Catenulispora yoronensis]|uniref:Hotdog domain-containing protein n=1 Tax=Catenulispora yoronensis TaxID=450799 RepID=A0ABP5FGY0_9ACTN
MTVVENGAPEPPLHIFRTRIWFDELDKVGVLHNARYAVHAERALTSWYDSRPELAASGDGRHLVKAYEIEFLVPVAVTGELDVELRVAKLGTTSCAYEFRFVGAGGVVHAVGRRTIVKTGADLRPEPWSAVFRQTHE